MRGLSMHLVRQNLATSKGNNNNNNIGCQNSCNKMKRHQDHVKLVNRGMLEYESKKQAFMRNAQGKGRTVNEMIFQPLNWLSV